MYLCLPIYNKWVNECSRGESQVIIIDTEIEYTSSINQT